MWWDIFFFLASSTINLWLGAITFLLVHGKMLLSETNRTKLMLMHLPSPKYDWVGLCNPIYSLSMLLVNFNLLCGSFSGSGVNTYCTLMSLLGTSLGTYFWDFISTFLALKQPLQLWIVNCYDLQFLAPAGDFALKQYWMVVCAEFYFHGTMIHIHSNDLSVDSMPFLIFFIIRLYDGELQNKMCWSGAENRLQTQHVIMYEAFCIQHLLHHSFTSSSIQMCLAKKSKYCFAINVSLWCNWDSH